MDVTCNHQIVAFGGDRMILFDSATGAGVVDANRPDAASPWTITAAGVPDITAPDRPTAITAMTEQALASLGGTGYSTLVPVGLTDQP
jgi:hypothetical protein